MIRARWLEVAVQVSWCVSLAIPASVSTMLADTSPVATEIASCDQSCVSLAMSASILSMSADVSLVAMGIAVQFGIASHWQRQLMITL
jgi:hypothetical protein